MVPAALAVMVVSERPRAETEGAAATQFEVDSAGRFGLVRSGTLLPILGLPLVAFLPMAGPPMLDLPVPAVVPGQIRMAGRLGMAVLQALLPMVELVGLSWYLQPLGGFTLSKRRAGRLLGVGPAVRAVAPSISLIPESVAPVAGPGAVVRVV